MDQLQDTQARREEREGRKTGRVRMGDNPFPSLLLGNEDDEDEQYFDPGGDDGLLGIDDAAGQEAAVLPGACARVCARADRRASLPPVRVKVHDLARSWNCWSRRTAAMGRRMRRSSCAAAKHRGLNSR